MNTQAVRLTALRAVVAVLVVIGIAGAINRLMNVAAAHGRPVAERAPLQQSDRAVVALTTFAMGLPAGTAEYVSTESVLTAFAKKFENHPVVTVMHMVPSILFMLLAPLQFSKAMRTRHRTLHRYTGRFLLLMATPIAISAIYFGVVYSLAGMSVWERPTIAIVATLFLYAAIRGFVAIRRRDVARHREWMLRMFAMALGISTTRLVSVVLTFSVKGSVEALTVMSMWIGWFVTMGAAELWIRHTRSGARRDASAIVTPDRAVVAT